MPKQEKLRCNICDAIVDTSEAKEHATGRPHVEKKSRLEGELAAAKAKTYSGDGSVADLWASAVTLR